MCSLSTAPVVVVTKWSGAEWSGSRPRSIDRRVLMIISKSECHYHSTLVVAALLSSCIAQSPRLPVAVLFEPITPPPLTSCLLVTSANLFCRRHNSQRAKEPFAPINAVAAPASRMLWIMRNYDARL